MNQQIPTNKARQGRKGSQVLTVLICALILAAIAWAFVEFYGQSIDEPQPGQPAPSAQQAG